MQVTVVAVVEEEVVAVEEDVAVVAGPEAAGPEVAAAAAGPEAEEMMTTTMTMILPVHHLAERVRPVEPDAGFSTIKRWNSNWLKSCKISARWRRDDALLVSRPPIPSRPRIRMDAVLP